MSRIREEHVHGLQTRAAVEHGISAIGRVVVAAALIMGTVFAAFILSADRIPKEFGLLLAVAILTDALIVRMTLVPAFLTLLGEKSWYIPRWLDRLLPNITIESPHERESPDHDRRRAHRRSRSAGTDESPQAAELDGSAAWARCYDSTRAGRPKSGNTRSVSRKNVSSTIRPSAISSTCSAHGS